MNSGPCSHDPFGLAAAQCVVLVSETGPPLLHLGGFQPVSSHYFPRPLFHPVSPSSKPDYRSPHPPKLPLTPLIRSIEVPFQRRNHGDIGLIFRWGLSVSKALWRLSSSLPSQEPRPCYDAQERRRLMTASIFTRFSTMGVRVHLSTPKRFVEIRHARRRENPCSGASVIFALLQK